MSHVSTTDPDAAPGSAPNAGIVAHESAVDEAVTSVARGFMPDIAPMYPFSMGWTRAIVAGIVGIAVVLLVEFLAPTAVGMHGLNAPRILGAMIDPTGGPFTVAGWVIQIAIGIVFALCYAASMLGIDRESTVGTGMAAGALFWVVLMCLVLPIMMGMRTPVLSGPMASPGYDIDGDYGNRVMMVMLVAWILYGGAVGAIYKHNARRVPREQAAPSGRSAAPRTV